MQLIIEKICIDIDEITMEDDLYSHLIDETLSFEQELRDTLGYPSSYCNTITVLTQAKYLTRWIRIEKQCTLNDCWIIIALLSHEYEYKYINLFTVLQLQLSRWMLS